MNIRSMLIGSLMAVGCLLFAACQTQTPKAPSSAPAGQEKMMQKGSMQKGSMQQGTMQKSSPTQKTQPNGSTTKAPQSAPVKQAPASSCGSCGCDTCDSCNSCDSCDSCGGCGSCDDCCDPCDDCCDPCDDCCQAEPVPAGLAQ